METRNRNFNKLNRFGTRNRNNCVNALNSNSTNIGVAVKTTGRKKATTLQMLLPTSRSFNGSRRIAKVTLTGRQARSLLATLRNHFER